MKKLNLLLIALLMVFVTNAQIKIFPGGPVSIGTTNGLGGNINLDI